MHVCWSGDTIINPFLAVLRLALTKGEFWMPSHGLHSCPSPLQSKGGGADKVGHHTRPSRQNWWWYLIFSAPPALLSSWWWRMGNQEAVTAHACTQIKRKRSWKISPFLLHFNCFKEQAKVDWKLDIFCRKELFIKLSSNYEKEITSLSKVEFPSKMHSKF